MRITVLIYLAFLGFATACKQDHAAQVSDADTVVTAQRAGSAESDTEEVTASQTDCIPGEELLYEDPNVFTTYTEDKIRGEGIISFDLDINERLDFYNMDGSVFGFLVLNDDRSYYTLNMPQKVIARKMITDYDFAAFDFDAENTAADKDYLIVYVNKEKRKVKKAGIKFTYETWPEYLRSNTIRLKPCNLLKAPDGTIIKKSLDQFFEITAVKGDMIEIKSTKECQVDGSYVEMQGWVKWRSADGLIIDFASCD